MVNNFVNIENFFLPTFTLKTDCLKQNNKHCKVGLTLKSLSRVQLFVTPMDYSLPGSSVHGIFQARVLEWGATAFSESSSGQLSVNPSIRDAWDALICGI